MNMKYFSLLLLCLLLFSLMPTMPLQVEASVNKSDILFFDFSHLDDYSGSQYGQWDFCSPKRWGTTGGTTDTLEINTDSNTLTIYRTDPKAYTYFYAQTWNADSTTRYPLSYLPKNGEYLQVRMKISGFDPAVKTTRFCLNYYINGSTTQQVDGASHSFGEGYAFDGEYITIRMKLNNAFRNATVINGIKLNFWDLKGTGSVVFDYVYIGPEAELPGEASLYFDFKNTTQDQSRYNTDTYSNCNFDTASSWLGTYLAGGARDTVSVNNTQGTLTVNKTASNNNVYFYAMNGTPLKYRPEQAEFLQMRVRLWGFKAAGSKSSFSLNYYTNGADIQYTDAATYKFEKGFIFEGEYLTITLPIARDFSQREVISQIKLNFWNLEGTGTVEFDYVYIGSKEGLPSKDYFRFGYVSSEGQGIVAQQNCPVTSGVTESTLKFNNEARNNPAVGFLTTIEQSAKVSFKASYSGYYTEGSTAESRKSLAPNLPWKLETTTSQAAAYETATGGKVLLATNADFYNVNTYQPLGYMIMEGNVLQSYGSRQQPFFAVLKDGSFVIRDFGAPTGDVAEAVSGVWLVKDGKNVTDTYYHSNGYKSNQPMNAIGLTEDGKVHIFVIDGRQETYSMGMDVNDLSNFFVSLGCVNAINLDGGGSATYASVHQGKQTLRLRNSPSDGKERAISNALLMISTEGECDHNYSKNYVMNSDGTHRVSCSKCDHEITSGHLYTNHRCLCGDIEEQPAYLYFDFGNKEEDRERYLNAAYGYWNFDIPSGNPWSNSNWSTANNGEKRNHYRIDNDAGLLIADVTDSGNGPLIAPTNTYGVFPWFLENFYGYFPLNFIPKNGEYFQIRFKTNGCSPVEGATPRVDLHYYYQKDDVYGGKVEAAVDFSIKNGTYQTFTLPLSDTFRNVDVIRDFAVRFRNLTSTGGSVSIDYIYMGPRANLPTALHTVTFVDGNGKTLQTQLVQNGNSATYTGPTPTKGASATHHYTFKGWDQSLANIQENTTVRAQFTEAAHGLTYSKVDTSEHKATCTCGYSRTESHNYAYKATDNPTPSATGVLTGTCSRCSATATVTLPKLNTADYTKSTVKAPTCTEKGTDSYKWNTTTYGTFTFTATTNATGHSYTYAPVDAMLHTVGCENCDLAEQAPHSYAEGLCICGEKGIKDPVELPTLKLGHTLNLASDISVNFVILKQNLEGFDPGSIYVECVMDTYEGNVKTGTKTVRLETVDKGIHYYFTLTGLTAIQMNDSIATTLYGTKDGQVYISPLDTYSIATYAYSQMNNPDRAESLKILCADLLRYGTKAQIFKSYRLDALADSAMTEEHKAYLSDMDTVTFGNTNGVLNDLPNAPITWAGKSLNLESKVALKFVFHPANYTGDLSALTLRISYTDAYGNTKTATAAHPTLYNAQLGYYVFTVDSLLAAELRAVVSAQIYAGNTPVSATLQYSPDTYGNGKSGALLELCKALFAYSDSAKAYFAP